MTAYPAKRNIFAYCECEIKCLFMFYLMCLQLFIIQSSPLYLAHFSHNLAHFQKFIEALLDYNFKNAFTLEPG